MRRFIALILVLATVFAPVAWAGNCSAPQQKMTCCSHCDGLALSGNCCCESQPSASSNLEKLPTASVSPALPEPVAAFAIFSIAAPTGQESHPVHSPHTPLFLLLGTFLS